LFQNLYKSFVFLNSEQLSAQILKTDHLDTAKEKTERSTELRVILDNFFFYDCI